MPLKTEQATIKAKILRKNMTPAERKLWSRIRNQLLGVKFRRQTPIGHYIVDFYCHEHCLVIELDGSQHQEQIEYDEIRTAYLQACGLTVIRFWNNDALLNVDAVLETIRINLKNTSPCTP